MKKNVITLLILLCCAFLSKAHAGIVIMDYNGETLVRHNSVERNLLINCNDSGEYDVAIKPLEDAITRSDGEVRIPLSNVYINNNHEDIYMRYNEYSNILHRAIFGGVAQNLVLKIRDYGMIPAGVYNLNVEIQAVDSDSATVEATSMFNLQLIIPTVQEINFHGETAKINVDPANAFARNKKITTETNPMLYINSNCDWVLTLDSTNFNNAAGNYYIRTISGSANINERLQERVLIEPGKEIILARGKAPANNEYIAIECSVEGKNGEILQAGNYSNSLKFVISEDRGR